MIVIRVSSVVNKMGAPCTAHGGATGIFLENTMYIITMQNYQIEYGKSSFEIEQYLPGMRHMILSSLIFPRNTGV